MGGCATKPKVSKDVADAKAKAPEPEPEPEQLKEDTVETKVVAEQEPPPQPQGQGGDNLNVNEIVDDDLTNKRRSLSLLFKEVEVLRPFDAINDINDTKQLWKIGVRIVDIWSVFNKQKHEHLEMVFMDAKGGRIQAVVPREDLARWKSRLKDKNTYVFENFVVYRNDYRFKACDHAYKLVFSVGTIFKEKELPDIPSSVYIFMEFGDILSGNYCPDLLVDCIGALHQVTFSAPNADPKKVVFTIKDVSDNLMTCTLWESLAMQFIDYRNRNGNSGQTIIILARVKINKGQGNWPPSISNAWNGTKLMINEDLVQIHDFKKRLPVTEVHESSSQMVTQTTGCSQFSDHDRFMYKAQVKSIGEINALQEDTTCVTVGTTGKIIVSKNGWTYDGCCVCTKKTNRTDNGFKCQKEHYTEIPVPRYKVEIEVVHKKESTKFVFWDKDCTDLIGFTALQLRQMMIEAGEDNPMVYPKILDDMLARTLAFRIIVQPSSNQSSVMKIWDDSKMIQTIMDHIEPEEPTSKLAKAKSVVNEDEREEPTSKLAKAKSVVNEDEREEPTSQLDNAKSNMNEDVHFETQSLSGTAEHDPDINSSITPVKRVSSESRFDEKLSQEIATAQLSSTKITQHIKTE